MLLLPLAVLFALDPGPLCTTKDLKSVVEGDYTILPGPRSLVATKGKLWDSTCAPEARPILHEVIDDAPIDFRRYVPLADGRLVFGGTGGLVVLDPASLRSTRLTTAETYYDTKSCWTFADKPVVGWDRDPRPSGHDGAVVFSRGGPCAYEGDATSTTMVVDVASGATRATTNVPTLVATSTRQVWLADGGDGCDDHQTKGTAFVRTWSDFVPVVIDAKARMGIVALAEAHGSIWALSGICDRGGAAFGGDLYRGSAAELAATNLFGVVAPSWSKVEVPFAKGERGVDNGGAIVALFAKKNDLYVARAKDAAWSWQVSKDGGKSWKPTRAKPTSAKSPKGLAATLGVVTIYGTLTTKTEQWAWSDDGAFVRDSTAGAVWRRAF